MKTDTLMRDHLNTRLKKIEETQGEMQAEFIALQKENEALKQTLRMAVESIASSSDGFSALKHDLRSELADVMNELVECDRVISKNVVNRTQELGTIIGQHLSIIHSILSALHGEDYFKEIVALAKSKNDKDALMPIASEIVSSYEKAFPRNSDTQKHPSWNPVVIRGGVPINTDRDEPV